MNDYHHGRPTDGLRVRLDQLGPELPSQTHTPAQGQARFATIEESLHGKANAAQVHRLEKLVANIEQAINEKADAKCLETLESSIHSGIAGIVQVVHEKAGAEQLKHLTLRVAALEQKAGNGNRSSDLSNQMQSGFESQLNEFKQAARVRASQEDRTASIIKSQLGQLDSRLAGMEQALQQKIGPNQVEDLESQLQASTNQAKRLEKRISEIENGLQEKVSLEHMKHYDMVAQRPTTGANSIQRLEAQLSNLEQSLLDKVSCGQLEQVRLQLGRMGTEVMQRVDSRILQAAAGFDQPEQLQGAIQMLRAEKANVQQVQDLEVRLADLQRDGVSCLQSKSGRREFRLGFDNEGNLCIEEWSGGRRSSCRGIVSEEIGLGAGQGNGRRPI